jgi:hypothetical protein
MQPIPAKAARIRLLFLIIGLSGLDSLMRVPAIAFPPIAGGPSALQRAIPEKDIRHNEFFRKVMYSLPDRLVASVIGPAPAEPSAWKQRL